MSEQIITAAEDITESSKFDKDKLGVKKTARV